MLRGLVFAAVMVIVRLFQGALINAWQTQAGLFSIVLLLLFVIGVAVWGVLDGRADAVANPDPDRRQDLAMVWLLAGLVAGVVSGAVSWLIALVYSGLYTGGLINELTTFAAFTALIVFLPGIIGVTGGRWRVDRNPRPGGKAGRTRNASTPTSSPPCAPTRLRPARYRRRRPTPRPSDRRRRWRRSSGRPNPRPNPSPNPKRAPKRSRRPTTTRKPR